MFLNIKTSDVDVQDWCSCSKAKHNVLLIKAFWTLHQPALDGVFSKSQEEDQTRLQCTIFYWTYIEILKKKHEVAPLLKFYLFIMYSFKCQKNKTLDTFSNLVSANIILVFDHEIKGPLS